jgi:large subunit ribosomal protein L25
MAIIKLAAEPREEVGSRASRKLRTLGFIPANLYSHGQPSIKLKLEYLRWSKHLTEQLHLVSLEFPDGKNQIAAVREIQRDPMSQQVAHVEFLAVKMDEVTEFHVPIIFEGTPKGAKDGGVKTISSDHVMVECLPTVVPDSLTVNITDLDIGDSINAGAMVMPEGVKLVTDPAVTLVSITAVRAVVEAVAAVTEAVEGAAEGEAAEGGEKKAEGADKKAAGADKKAGGADKKGGGADKKTAGAEKKGGKEGGKSKG